MRDDRPMLTLAHSADADDVFMWWPITGKLAAAPPHEPTDPPVLDTGRFRYRGLPGDIQEFNRRALETGDLEISAVSFATAVRVRDRYIPTACGSSVGDGYGPKLVARAGEAERVRARLSEADGTPLRLAVPGLATSAYLAFASLFDARRVAPVEAAFDRIIGAVAGGSVEAGIVIHEGQLMFERHGLELVVDLGAAWKRAHDLPLPLGANVVRRDLDDRFGKGALREVARTLRASIDYALAHRGESLEYAARFSPLRGEELDRYVGLYVNPFTLDLGDRGRAALDRLITRGEAMGVFPEGAGFAQFDILVP